jgi:galactose mutarotase-like enzyme
MEIKREPRYPVTRSNSYGHCHSGTGISNALAATMHALRLLFAEKRAASWGIVENKVKRTNKYIKTKDLPSKTNQERTKNEPKTNRKRTKFEPKSNRKRTGLACRARAATALPCGPRRRLPHASPARPACSVTLRHKAASLPDEPFLLFNVWGDAKNGYFSPEPWVGIQNSLNLAGGTIRLAPGGQWGLGVIGGSTRRTVEK